MVCLCFISAGIGVAWCIFLVDRLGRTKDRVRGEFVLLKLRIKIK